MKHIRGKFIVIDGADATGKKTQTEMLEARIKHEHAPVIRLAFPRYHHDSSYLVRMYLGRDNPAAPDLLRSPERLGPYFASVFYALDRREAADEIRQLLAGGTHIICDRYVTSNMGHQGGLIADAVKRKKYYQWIREFEFGILDLPKPDCTLFLHVPLDIAAVLLQKRLHRASLFGANDRQDSLDDISLQKRAHETYEELARLYHEEFTFIECAQTGIDTLLSAEAIHEKIWSITQPMVLRR